MVNPSHILVYTYLVNFRISEGRSLVFYLLTTFVIGIYDNVLTFFQLSSIYIEVTTCRKKGIVRYAGQNFVIIFILPECTCFWFSEIQ